ncbi:hypothetical protein ANCDUO_01660 [Ancylostoma duodenale]|uniref:Uncharacterized protein n=1 Tax=Ancylostoma duodenale TaxID=51022 RepID=A0A0C2HEN7_9BILA|nr:hypothetical protein ANCDUO_01660 [Ancylostoma duodenale]
MDTSVVQVLEGRLTTLRQNLPSNYYVIHLAAVFGDLDVVDDNRCAGLQYLSKLEEFSNAFATTVAREEALRILKIRLLQKLSRYTGISKARQNKCFYHVMVPCNSDELAELMITQLCLGREHSLAAWPGMARRLAGGPVSLGRPALRPVSQSSRFLGVRSVGGCVSEMTDVVEKTPGGTTFIRPLRDVTSEEIATALHLENVEHYALLPELKIGRSPCLHACEASKTGSLQQMSSDFLKKFIEDGFKGTVPTVLGISSKVHASTGGARCPVCDLFSDCVDLKISEFTPSNSEGISGLVALLNL